MVQPLQRHVQVQLTKGGGIRRRDFLRGVSAAGLAAGSLTWHDLVCLRADELRRRRMACILLWMQGGPSQFETFSPKHGHENGGPTKAIATSVPGIEISENLPHLAQSMQDLAIIRSMKSTEGNHQRASYLLHTGYTPTPAVKYPTLGSLVTHQIGDTACQLPSFVRIGRGSRDFGGGGLLGVQFDPFEMPRPDQPPANTRPTTDRDRYHRRLSLLGDLQADYAATGGRHVVADHQQLYDKATRMILSEEMVAFDLDRESDPMRDAYGRTQFGAGCLLSRRLVEAGVTFVEVASGGWDTHQDNFERVSNLTEQIDQPFAQLIADLKQRGLLETTLVIWAGEFGRTPKINARGGRDHFPRAFNVALAGGGIRGGQVIGSTDDGGTAVTDRPVSVADLFRTYCHSLQIDPDTENMSPIGRPIPLVDGGQVVRELFA